MHNNAIQCDYDKDFLFPFSPRVDVVCVNNKGAALAYFTQINEDTRRLQQYG